jgi:hypothetical protein
MAVKAFTLSGIKASAASAEDVVKKRRLLYFSFSIMLSSGYN